MTASIVLTLAAVYAARMAVIVFGIRAYRLGDGAKVIKDSGIKPD